MRTFTAVTRHENATMPPGLEPLEAPVTTEEPSAPGEHVGQAEGVLLDGQGSIVAFVVRLSKHLAPEELSRTLVPAAAIELRAGTLHVSWTEGQLLAQPRLDAGFQAHDRANGGAPVRSQWMPARPNLTPPGTGVNVHEAAKEGAAGGAMGAVIGAAAGMAVAGPIGAAALAVFFAAGGSLAGLISGGSQESAAEASELRFDAAEELEGRPKAKKAKLAALAERLRDPATVEAAGLYAVRFVPATRTERAA